MHNALECSLQLLSYLILLLFLYLIYYLTQFVAVISTLIYITFYDHYPTEP